ncbi:MAG TPA: 50S ribosomal protein L10 [Verrucomicrobiales bacterium]|nr:50S ribosomal protein L10 [Verrucomicrobiales bacterium]
MQAEKQTLIDELVDRIQSSPFLLVTDYTGLTVSQFGVLRGRLRESGARYHVAKNTYLKRVASNSEFPEYLSGAFSGQTAIVTGQADVCAAAKVLKTFEKEFQRPKIRAGLLDGRFLAGTEVLALAELPPREVLLAQLLGLIQAPATGLVRLLNEPGSRLARLLQAHVDKNS